MKTLLKYRCMAREVDRVEDFVKNTIWMGSSKSCIILYCRFLEISTGRSFCANESSGISVVFRLLKIWTIDTPGRWKKLPT